MLSVTLYSKAQCHLCADVRDDLARLARTYPHHLHEVDITSDRELFARYRFLVPVVIIGDGPQLRAPISIQQLESALAAASG